jgi:hypothetical protein
MRAISQPALLMMNCPVGTSMNWPKEPAAPTMASAMARFSGAMARPTAP